MMTTFPNTELKKSLSLLFEMRLTNVRYFGFLILHLEGEKAT